MKSVLPHEVALRQTIPNVIKVADETPGLGGSPAIFQLPRASPFITTKQSAHARLTPTHSLGFTSPVGYHCHPAATPECCGTR